MSIKSLIGDFLAASRVFERPVVMGGESAVERLDIDKKKFDQLVADMRQERNRSFWMSVAVIVIIVALLALGSYATLSHIGDTDFVQKTLLGTGGLASVLLLPLIKFANDSKVAGMLAVTLPACEPNEAVKSLIAIWAGRST